MNYQLSQLEFNALKCLARRTQGKPTFYPNAPIEIWVQWDLPPSNIFDIGVGICLICNQQVCDDNAIAHARHHLKEHNLTALL